MKTFCMWVTRAAVAAWLCTVPAVLFAQSPVAPASTDLLEAYPNRPSSSNSADVLAPGVLQWEYGWSQEWENTGELRSALGGEVRFGVWRNIEFRWGGDPLVSSTSPTDHNRGFGDQYFSGQVRLREQSTRAPAVALSYAIKVPTASESQGLGSGRTDHSFTFLASKEIRKITFDFNASYQLMGREGSTGYDQDSELFFTFQRDLYGPLSLIGEVGGTTKLNAASPAFATTLWAMAYKVHRQVVLDVAVDAGITQGAPHNRILFGFTYAIANLYPRHQDH